MSQVREPKYTNMKRKQAFKNMWYNSLCETELKTTHQYLYLNNHITKAFWNNDLSKGGSFVHGKFCEIRSPKLQERLVLLASRRGFLRP